MQRRSHFILLAGALLIAACNQGKPSQGAASGDTAPAKSDGAPGTISLPVRQEVLRNDSCSFNAPQPEVRVARDKALAIWGYAFDPDSDRIPDAIWIRMTGSGEGASMVIRAERGERADVATALGRPELLKSGFGAEIDVQGMLPGAYRISVLQQVGDKYLVCEMAGPITLS